MKNFALIAFTFCVIFAAINSSRAAPPEGCAPAVATYDRLHQTELFALGGTGIAGTTSPGEIAFRELQKEPDVTAAFAALIDDETTAKAGQLYALLGLKEAKSPEFEARLPTFLADDSAVTQMIGCIRIPAKVKDIATRFVDEK